MRALLLFCLCLPGLLPAAEAVKRYITLDGTRLLSKPAAFSKTSFIDRYVFPDGEIQPMATVIDALERAGFEVRDVESLREHYSLTLRAWVANLEENWEEAVTFSSAGRARIWRLYMTGSALGFTANRLGINQILAVKCDEHGHSGIPSTRTDLLRSGAVNR